MTTDLKAEANKSFTEFTALCNGADNAAVLDVFIRLSARYCTEVAKILDADAVHRPKCSICAAIELVDNLMHDAARGAVAKTASEGEVDKFSSAAVLDDEPGVPSPNSPWAL
jgi:hypothetical protein